MFDKETQASENSVVKVDSAAIQEKSHFCVNWSGGFNHLKFKIRQALSRNKSAVSRKHNFRLVKMHAFSNSIDAHIQFQPCVYKVARLMTVPTSGDETKSFKYAALIIKNFDIKLPEILEFNLSPLVNGNLSSNYSE